MSCHIPLGSIVCSHPWGFLGGLITMTGGLADSESCDSNGNSFAVESGKLSFAVGEPGYQVSISAFRNGHRIPNFVDFPTWPTATTPPPIRHLKLLLVKTPWVPGRFRNLVEFFLHDQWYADLDPSMEIFLGILDRALCSPYYRWQMLAPGYPSTLPSSPQLLESSISINYKNYISSKRTRAMSDGC